MKRSTPLSEHRLQRAAQFVLSDPRRTWTATDGSRLQVIASGSLNVHDGPDFLETAVMHDGVIHVGDTEFHVRSSDWNRHQHDANPRYGALLLHVVIQEDVVLERAARWTLIVDVDELTLADKRQRRIPRAEVAVEELQHFALLRLLRLTAEASSHIRRVGRTGAIKAMCAYWLERFDRKRRRPSSDAHLSDLPDLLPASPLGKVALHFSEADPAQIFAMLDSSERVRVAGEGAALRREILTNVILPILCAIADPQQRVVLLQWYWSIQAVHPYGMLRRKFPSQSQNLVWQQQGMLEYLRDHGRRTTSCGEAIRSYGLEPTIEFLRADSRP